MRKSKIMTIGEREITAKELTVEQVAAVMESIEGQQIETLDLLFSDRVPAEAVRISTDLTKSELEALAPSELDVIWAGVEEINPFFVGMVGRLAQVGAAALAADLSGKTSK